VGIAGRSGRSVSSYRLSRFSLETPEGLRFIIRSRIFTDEEWLILKDEKVHLGNGELVLVS
jgi:hypothetical protein